MEPVTQKPNRFLFNAFMLIIVNLFELLGNVCILIKLIWNVFVDFG